MFNLRGSVVINYPPTVDLLDEGSLLLVELRARARPRRLTYLSPMVGPSLGLILLAEVRLFDKGGKTKLAVL